MTLEERVEKIEQRLDALEKEGRVITINSDELRNAIEERAVIQRPFFNDRIG